MEMVQYFRNKKGQAIGVFLAKPLGDDAYGFGISKCKMHADKFDANKGLMMAHARADTLRGIKVPASMVVEFKHFAERAAKYFKDKKIHPSITLP